MFSGHFYACRGDNKNNVNKHKLLPFELLVRLGHGKKLKREVSKGIKDKKS